MSGLATLLRRLGSAEGIEITDDELAELGLSSDESADEAQDHQIAIDDVLSGEAAGAIEIFLSEPLSMLAGGKAVEQDGLMWEPIIREGQWAVRPGPRGQKRRSPLKVVAGRSTNQRKQIGLQDIVDAFNDGAIEHVTVPTSHDNKVTENTGFIKGLKIVQAKIKDKLSKTDKKVAVLMGAYDIRKGDIKASMLDGSIASRSAGLLYDYVNTETGKTYPVALEHVALTNKPWITGMKAFGRKLAKALTSQPIGLSLSDDEPDDSDLLADEDALDGIELAVTASTWTQDEDPDWLREQTSNVLRAARAAKVAKANPGGADSWVVADGFPHYRCVKAKPGVALIADGWGDEANFWTAPIKVVDGFVEVEEDLDKWEAVKREFVSDEDRKEFPAGREPLKDEAPEPPIQLSRIERAKLARRTRGTKAEGVKPEDKTTTTSRGGEHMAGENGTLQLSEEAQRLIREAQEEAKAAREENKKLSQQVNALLGDATVSKADANIAQLKRDGFTEERGFAGVLAEVRQQMLADDGEPAVQGDNFATDGNSEGTLSLSECLMRVFKAFERAEDGTLKLGQQVVQPPEVKTGEDGNETKLGEDGKPLPTEPEGEKPFDELSEDEQLKVLLADNPEMASALSRVVKVPSANSNGNGGES